MKPEIKSMNSNKCLLSFPVVGKTLSHYFIVSSGRLLEVLKTTFWIAIAITVSLLVGQLH